MTEESSKIKELKKIFQSCLSHISGKVKHLKHLINEIEGDNLSDDQVEYCITAFNELIDIQSIIEDFKEKLNRE